MPDLCICGHIEAQHMHRNAKTNWEWRALHCAKLNCNCKGYTMLNNLPPLYGTIYQVIHCPKCSGPMRVLDNGATKCYGTCEGHKTLPTHEPSPMPVQAAISAAMEDPDSRITVWDNACDCCHQPAELRPVTVFNRELHLCFPCIMKEG